MTRGMLVESTECHNDQSQFAGDIQVAAHVGEAKRHLRLALRLLPPGRSRKRRALEFLVRLLQRLVEITQGSDNRQDHILRIRRLP